MSVPGTQAANPAEQPQGGVTTEAGRQTDLAAQLARISHELLGQKDEPLTLQRIVELAVETVPGCEWAGVSLRTSRSPAEAVAATHQMVYEADKLQEELQEGPCFDTSQDDELHISADLATDQRWPTWGPRAAQQGIRSVLSVQLRGADDDLLGALNLYSGGAGAFSRADLDDALLFASHAGGALAQSRELTGLREALRSRHLIGVAQGMLMQRYHVTLDQAFAILSRHSQQRNVKLRDVAAEIVESGSLGEGTGESVSA
ncbi:MAG TPA: GAF and ANTAR domain-containing protein [Ornithinicoccus sp.]|nr:GAF and ANTAR domain-containing protein [Ornithinicoccus sp.]